MDKQELMISVEFFPPKTEEGMAKLREARTQLARLNPRQPIIGHKPGQRQVA